MSKWQRCWLGRLGLLLPGLSLAMLGARADEVDSIVQRDPLYQQLHPCLQSSEVQHLFAQARHNGASLEVQLGLFRAAGLPNPAFERFLAELYAAGDTAAFLAGLHGRCVAHMSGVPLARATACYRQFLMPFYAATAARPQPDDDATAPTQAYLACLHR